MLFCYLVCLLQLRSQLFSECHDVLCSIIIMDPDLMDSGTFWAGRIRNFLSGSGFDCRAAQFCTFFCSEVIEFDIYDLHTMVAEGYLISINLSFSHLDDEKKYSALGVRNPPSF
jgi:hypothetical protein